MPAILRLECRTRPASRASCRIIKTVSVRRHRTSVAVARGCARTLPSRFRSPPFQRADTPRRLGPLPILRLELSARDHPHFAARHYSLRLATGGSLHQLPHRLGAGLDEVLRPAAKVEFAGVEIEAGLGVERGEDLL